MMNCYKIEELRNYEQIYINGATVSVLSKFLDPSIPWVWLLGHYPNRYVQWWKANVPVNSVGSTFGGLVRNLCFDLQMPTSAFISRVKEFDEHGIMLIQSHQKMPDTLNLEYVPDSQRNDILIQNGATLEMYLPHAIETAQVRSFIKGYLSKVISANLH